jgi:serine/threonine-protein kinase
VSTPLGPGGRFGDYTIDSLLGRGGMSVVYLAEDRRLGRQVAIKLLAEELAEDGSFRTRFIRESQLAAGLEHPNIVPVYEAGELEGRLFIAMRYVRGTDLRTLISRAGPLAPERAMALLRPIASALDAAHRRGLVHRDVKPANILIAVDEGEEHPYLSDFGLTKHTSSKSGLTKTGQFMGTVDYVAPEQIRGDEVDGRTDEYSLACVLYQCLTGEVPFDKPADVATMFGHLQDPPPKVSLKRPDLPSELDDVVTRGMAKEREDRFPTCTALMEALNAAGDLPSLPREQPSFDPTVVAMPPQPGTGSLLPAAPEGASAPPATPSAVGGAAPTPGPGPARGNARRAVVIGGLIVAAIVVVALVVVSLGGEEPAPAPGPTGATGPATAFANERSIGIPHEGI